ncbi:hypothetical protein I3760_05G074600 [Carya illinoinensis]|nr:hypothetical protein I3760_05G074600 [Carya illinoinensis]KAG2705854.1 hypothetical protein I3760_05G074600 [Carya illinoinensis]
MPSVLFHPHPQPLTPPLSHHRHPPLCTQKSPTAWFLSARPTGFLSLRPKTGSTIRCMANPRRVKMVAKQIRRELSDMLLTDTVLQYAILPEASLGADRYLSSLTTISDVEVSGDLQVIAILDKIKNEKNNEESQDVEQSDPSNVSQDDGHWEGDDPDEDIIYVN